MSQSNARRRHFRARQDVYYSCHLKYFLPNRVTADNINTPSPTPKCIPNSLFPSAMFPHISAFLAIAVAVAASARMERHLHVRHDNTQAPSQCNTGQLRCCNSVFNVCFHRLVITRAPHVAPRKATDLGSLLDGLSVPYDSSDNVGINCTPFNIMGAGQSAGCQQQPMCCSDNQYVSLGHCLCPGDFSNLVPLGSSTALSMLHVLR